VDVQPPPGVRWHDGSPFTADDVVATFDRVTNPSVGSHALSFFMGLLSRGNTRKVNAHRVTFHLNRPYVDFPYLVSAFNYDTIILPKNYKIGSFLKGGIGTGPFILTKYTPQVGATFARNPHYWRHGLPYLDGAEMKFYSGNPASVLAASVLAMEAGAVDVLPEMPDRGAQALFSNPGIRVLSNPSSAYRELSMRVDRKPFADRRVRQAIALCLNRPALVQGLLQGLETV
jgi:peptide/nickel transport system substrate-binding protein